MRYLDRPLTGLLRRLTGWVLALLVTAGLPAWAATPDTVFPSRPVTIVVPYTPGGSPDVLARAIAQQLSQRWAQPVVVENRPGAGGNIAAAYVARAAADGYTLLMGSDGPLAINPFIYGRLPFDPLQDFAPAALLASVDFMLVTQPSSSAATVREFIALARKERPALTYGSSGAGSQHHLGMEMFKSMAQVDLVHVPYKGVVPALSDVMGGHVAAMFVAVPTAAPYVRSGRLKAIAVSGKERSPLVPGVPTIDESGLPGFELRAWFGLLAPAATPSRIVSQINSDANAVSQRPEMKSALQDLGFRTLSETPEGFARFLKAEQGRWKQVVRDSGAKAD